MPLNPQQIKELEAYRGTNPIPADFDDFWSERMAEADDVALDYEIVPSRVPSFDT
ncbi:MAG: acetylxylan esterase, partial [Olsenella sp.]